MSATRNPRGTYHNTALAPGLTLVARRSSIQKGVRMRLSVAGLVLGLIGCCSVYAQSVISAHSGVIHYVEGRVLLGDTPVDLKFAQFPDLKENQELRTEEGRAEVLLTPGAFLRIGENSSIRMLSNHLTDTRVEVLSGSALLECTEMLKDNALMLVYSGNTMIVEKAGLYRVDTDPARFRVYEGQAVVKSDSGQLTLKAGKETLLNGVLAANKFDNKIGDELYRWSSRRAGYVAAANVSAARSTYTSSSGVSAGGWQFNPWFGMYTFVPFGSGVLYSPFGYSYWSPYAAYWYAPGYYYGGGNGWRGGSGSSGRAAYTSAASRTSGDFTGAASGRAISGGFGARDGGSSGGGMPSGGFGSRGSGGMSSGGMGGGGMSAGGGGGFGSHGGGGAGAGASSGGAHTGGGRGSGR